MCVLESWTCSFVVVVMMLQVISGPCLRADMKLPGWESRAATEPGHLHKRDEPLPTVGSEHSRFISEPEDFSLENRVESTW